MIKAHKIRLQPTPEQASYFAKAAGTARFVWNWALAEWNRQYEAGEKSTALGLKKQFNEIRREHFPWTWNVTKNASDQPILDLGKAFTAFFEGRARRPRFKSKKRSKPSFYLANDQFELGDHRIWIPKLGSNNREKARKQVARLHYRITCMRDDVLHKLTTRLATCYGIIGIEDLNLKGLLKNRRLSRSFSDAALGKLLNLLDAKVEQRGGQVIKVGRFFPSSKTCHSCGWKWENMQLSDRVFLCQHPTCAYYQVAQDRDYNASLNILREALHLIGLIDQVVNGIGSDEDANLAVDAG